MKRQTFIFSIIVFISTFFAPAYSAEQTPDPQLLLNAMSKASRDLNYDGVFVYRMGKQTETMRIIHKSGDDGVYERLVLLTGNAREVIRDKEEVKCYFPENKSVVVDKSRLGKLISGYLPSPVQSISEFYSFDIIGENRVAGMNAWIVNIRPNDKYRYGYQLWIDKESKLLLKSELKNQLGVTLEQIMFAKLDILEHIDDSLLKPNISAKGYTWYNVSDEKEVVNANGKQWKVTWVPAGFSMSEHAKEPMAMSKMPVEHLVYTDGLAMVSVFVEKTKQQASKSDGRTTKFGGVNAYAVYTNGYQITAVGEVPKTTVKQMADSVKSFH